MYLNLVRRVFDCGPEIKLRRTVHFHICRGSYRYAFCHLWQFFLWYGINDCRYINILFTSSIRYGYRFTLYGDINIDKRSPNGKKQLGNSLSSWRIHERARIVIYLISKVEGDELTGICLPGQQTESTLLHQLIVPHSIFLGEFRGDKYVLLKNSFVSIYRLHTCPFLNLTSYLISSLLVRNNRLLYVGTFCVLCEDVKTQPEINITRIPIVLQIALFFPFTFNVNVAFPPFCFRPVSQFFIFPT